MKHPQYIALKILQPCDEDGSGCPESLRGFFNIMKKCYKCKEEKPLLEFNKNQNKCKNCEKKYYIENKSKIDKRNKCYYELNKDRNREYGIQYRKLNKDKIANSKKQYYEKNKEKHLERGKIHYNENKEKYAKNKKIYRLINKDKIRESGAIYYQLNKERIIQNVSEYRIKNKDKLREKKKEYVKRRKKNEPLFKFKIIVRGIVCNSFKRRKGAYNKTLRTEEILGCSLFEFKEYITSRFSEGMSMDNHGEWHLDHIIPLATAKTEEDIIKLNHYTNFQPLWAIDNLRKGYKITDKE